MSGDARVGIVRVESAAQLGEVRRLFAEYGASLPIDLSFQNFERELRELPGDYAPPAGCILLARYGEEMAGCIALRPLSRDVGEGKRLYVRPAFRGRDVGKALQIAMLQEARRLGYRAVRWDSLGFMTAANALYRSLGARNISPYHDQVIDGMLFWEIDLAADVRA